MIISKEEKEELVKDLIKVAKSKKKYRWSDKCPFGKWDFTDDEMEELFDCVDENLNWHDFGEKRGAIPDRWAYISHNEGRIVYDMENHKFEFIGEEFLDNVSLEKKVSVKFVGIPDDETYGATFRYYLHKIYVRVIEALV